MMSRVFIPLEVVKRELLGKVLIATSLAASGLTVVIGHKGAVFKKAIDQKVPGILFYKSATDRIRIPFQKKGFKVVAQDEEAGIAFESFEKFFEIRKAHKNTEKLDKYFCWGPEEFTFFTKTKKFSQEIFCLSGSPRTVLWGDLGRNFYKEEISLYQQELNQYVLFVTNFDLANFYHGDPMPNLKKIHDKNWNEKLKKIAEARLDYQKNLLEIYLNLIEKVLNETDYNIIIRPHPIENINFWNSKFINHARVKIIGVGESTPLVLAARCLIHDGSTVGIEAVSADVPNLSLSENIIKKPIDYNFYGSVEMSIKCEDLNDVIKKIDNCDEIWKNEREAKKKLLNNKVYMPGTLEPLKIITKEIKELQKNTAVDTIKKFKFDFFLEIYILFLQLPKLISFHTGRQHRQKRPKITKKQLTVLVDKSLVMLNDESIISIKRVAPSCFEISRK